MTDESTTEAGVYRIGAVSRLTGVPVSTLRVWETRYAAFAPDKSKGRHRLYPEPDLVRARLLRQLTEAGHSIGGIATLPVQQLQGMLSSTRESTRAPMRAAAQAGAVTAVVVGAGLAARLNAPAWQQRALQRELKIASVFVDLQAMRAAEGASFEAVGAGLLLARLNTIQPGVPELLAAACHRFRIHKAIVLYNFAAEATLESLRAAGVILRREPIPDAELAQLIDAVLLVDPALSMPSRPTGGLIPRRRYTDATLAKVAGSTTGMLCECPRHLADLITQLASFEAYSEECLNTTAEDAEVHGYLRSISGSARALFEHALDLVARHGGMDLATDPAGETSSPTA